MPQYQKWDPKWEWRNKLCNHWWRRQQDNLSKVIPFLYSTKNVGLKKIYVFIFNFSNYVFIYLYVVVLNTFTQLLSSHFHFPGLRCLVPTVVACTDGAALKTLMKWNPSMTLSGGCAHKAALTVTQLSHLFPYLSKLNNILDFELICGWKQHFIFFHLIIQETMLTLNKTSFTIQHFLLGQMNHVLISTDE